MSTEEPPSTLQQAAGPDPVTQSAAFNPYTTTGQSLPVQSPQSAVHPNPATISHPIPPSQPVDHGHSIAERTVGSQRLFRWLAYGFELLKGLLILIILGILVNLFVATVFRISGESMLPNFADGQFILVDKLSYLVHAPLRGDVVVIRFPGDPDNRKFIKRVIGLPGEKVEVREGHYYVDDRLLQEPYLPAGLETTPELVTVLRGDEFFLSGDNRPNSNDSRYFGPVPRNEFIGKSQAILSGSAFGWVAQPAL